MGQKAIAIGAMLFITVALTVFAGLLGLLVGLGATAFMAPALFRL